MCYGCFFGGVKFLFVKGLVFVGLGFGNVFRNVICFCWKISLILILFLLYINSFKKNFLSFLNFKFVMNIEIYLRFLSSFLKVILGFLGRR